jgi:hypothetical protein
MGRVLFTPKSEPTKAEPAIDWSEVESRLQEISAPAHLSPDTAIEHSVTLANDPPAAIDRPVPAPRDPFEMLSLLAAIPTNRS